MRDFEALVDLASARLGGTVLFANDDFFAPKENLLRPEPAVFDVDRYTDRGKWMDGWESRRRRTEGHDFCVVRLGLPGRVRGIDVDTSHFTGNYPEGASLDLADLPSGAAAESLDAAVWREAVPRSALRGDSRNLFEVRDFGRATHVRLHIYPDGGVARLRVHGDVVPDLNREDGDGLVDLSALENGGYVVGSSDSYFGAHQNLLMPGPGLGMKDGWETKRSRRPGFDWVIVRLGRRGIVTRASIDTSFFKGNFPDEASLETCDAPVATLEELTEASLAWHPLLPPMKLQADTRHVFEKELLLAEPATHARLRIYPDGGVSRLRLFGVPRLPGALERLNAADRNGAREMLTSLCGSTRFASTMEEKRPFANHLSFLAAVDAAFEEILPNDWLESFRAHPRIGDRAAAGSAATEQADVRAAPVTVLDRLRTANAEYEERFGHVFLVCASGRPGDALLANLEERLGNTPAREIEIAKAEQRKITRLRVAKFLEEGG